MTHIKICLTLVTLWMLMDIALSCGGGPPPKTRPGIPLRTSRDVSNVVGMYQNTVLLLFKLNFMTGVIIGTVQRK